MTEATLIPRPRSTKTRGVFARNYQAVVFYLAILVLWEIAYRMGWVRTFILPGPSLIAEAVVNNGWLLFTNALTTAREILIGFVLGSSIGFLAALGIFYSPFLRRVLYPGAVILQTIPKVAIAPLFIIWFGVGETSIVAIAALICLFPTLVNTLTGFERVDVSLLEMMHSLSASGWQKFWMIRLPASLPSIFAGLQVGMSLAVIGAIVGEFVGASSGLGYQILLANSRIDTAEVFAAIFVVSMLGITFYFGVRLLGQLVVGQRSNVNTN